MTAYYNEIDPVAAQWLRNLIAAGHIAPGEVDERSIEDVTPADLMGFTQCHFFAGIGIWSYSLRRAGWSDDTPVWTGSCPCQPFSAAGKGGGFDDERHLWPAWHYLIEQCQPAVVFGEQVASKDGYAWLDLVQTDLEELAYACGAVVSPAAGYGAPHIRHRTYFMAHAPHQFDNWRGRGGSGRRSEDSDRRPVDALDNTASTRCVAEIGDTEGKTRDEARLRVSGARCDAGNMADPDDDRLQGRAVEALQRAGRRNEGDAPRCAGASLAAAEPATGPVNGRWRDADWLFCRDGKWRPVEPGTFPLAHGAPGRVGRLRAYGNGLCAEEATGFIEAGIAAIDDILKSQA